MACTHDRTVLRLLHHGAGQPQCMECLFDLLRSQSASQERQAASLRGFASTLLSREARAFRLAGRLLWHTPFLQRVVAVLGDSVHQNEDTQSDSQEKPLTWRPILLEFASTVVADEMRSGESKSGGSLCPDLMEALVALVASRCHDKLPVLLLGYVLERLDSDVAVAFLNRIQMSAPLLAVVVDMLVEMPHSFDASLGLDSIANLVLRLTEQGFQALEPHLAAASGRFSYLLSVTPPGAPLATHLLALYSLCALHPHLLQCLLSRETATHLKCLAQGVQMHLAASSGTHRGAAVSLIHELASAVPLDIAGSWLRTCFLAEWLTEICATSDDICVRIVAARALSHVGDDDKLMRQMQGFVADALLGCCSDAISAAGAGTFEARKELLDVATCSLSRVLAVECPTPASLVHIGSLLRAACAALPIHDGTSAGIDSAQGFNIAECLFPVHLNLSARLLDATEDEVVVPLLEKLEVLSKRTDVGSDGPVFRTLCVLLITLARSSPALQSPSDGDFDAMHLSKESCTPGMAVESPPKLTSSQSLRLQVESYFLSCSCALGRNVVDPNAFAIDHLVSALEAVLWPEFARTGSSYSTGVRSWPGSEWWHSVNELGKLLQPLLIAVGVAPDNSNVGTHKSTIGRHDVSRLVSVLLAPAMQSLSADEQCLLIYPNECLAACSRMLTQAPAASPQVWLLISALMHTVAQHCYGQTGTSQWMDRFEFSFLTCFLDCSEPWENSWMMQLPLRALVFLSAAAARLSISSATANLGYDTATSVLLSTTRLRLQPAMSVIFQTENALGEWFVLRGSANFGKDLALSLRWFLEAEEDDSVDFLLRGVVQFEEKTRTRLMSISGASPTSSFLGSVITSKKWLIARIVALLKTSPRWELPAFIHLASAMITEDMQVARTFLEQGGLAVIVELWQVGIASESFAELLICVLSSAPADAFDSQAVTTFCTVLERASLSGAVGLPLATHVSTFALWRQDVLGLASLHMANWLHLHIVCCLNGELQGLEEPAWAAITLLLISASTVSDGQLQSQSSGLMQLIQALGFHCASSWLGGLRNPDNHTRMFATLGLAAAACASSRAIGGGCMKYILPGASELSSIVSACAQNVFNECQMVRDASYLAISALLTCCSYPQQIRARLLHSESSQQQAFDELLKGNVIEIDSDSMSSEIETTTLSTTSALLYALVMLRSNPLWLERSLFMPHALPLARIARKDPFPGRSSQRLLAMRVLESVLAYDMTSLPPCSAAVLMPLLEDESVWMLAAKEATGVAQDRWRCLNLSEDVSMPTKHSCDGRPDLCSSRRCFDELHSSVIEWLCEEISA